MLQARHYPGPFERPGAALLVYWRTFPSEWPTCFSSEGHT